MHITLAMSLQLGGEYGYGICSLVMKLPSDYIKQLDSVRAGGRTDRIYAYNLPLRIFLKLLKGTVINFNSTI
jgi:hypothetical protein